MRCIVMIPLDELKKRDPVYEAVAARAAIDPQAAQMFYGMLVPLETGAKGVPVPHIRVSTTYACEGCQKTLEKAAAKAPSWAVVEFNRGPAEKRIIA